MTFKKGESGNKAGRPRRTAKESAKRKREVMLARLDKLSRTAKSDIARVTASVKWLEFSAGKPSAAREPIDPEVEALREADALAKLDTVDAARRIAAILLSVDPPPPAVETVRLDLAGKPASEPPYAPETEEATSPAPEASANPDASCEATDGIAAPLPADDPPHDALMERERQRLIRERPPRQTTALSGPRTWGGRRRDGGWA